MDNFLVENPGSELFKVPYSLYVPNQTKLLSTKNEALNNKFPLSFEYNLNSYGFRYNEPKSDNILLSVGCSMTFGQGLPEEYVYPYMVSKELGYECVNVALPGTGPDIQIMNATWSLLKYKPKIVLFYMSTPNRRFLATENGFMNWIPQYDHESLTKIEKRIFLTLDEKYSFTRTLQTIWQLYPFVQLCNSIGTKLYFRCWDGEANAHIMKYEFMNNVIDMGNINSKLDKARDDLHPGVMSHQEYAERIINAIRL